MVQAARRVVAKDPNEKLAHRRMTVLELAERLNNVTEARRRRGIRADVQSHPALLLSEDMLDGRTNRGSCPVSAAVRSRHRAVLELFEVDHRATAEGYQDLLITMRAVGRVCPHPAIERLQIQEF